MKKILFLFCCLILQNGFAQNSPSPTPIFPPDSLPKLIFHPTDDSEIATNRKQIIVSFPQGTTQTKRVYAKTELQRMYKILYNSSFEVISVKSCLCDTLELWQLNQDVIIEGHGETAGIKPPPVGGAGDFLPIYFSNGLSPNFDLDDFKEKQNKNLTPVNITYNNDDKKGEVFKIAIMDTGLDVNKIKPNIGLVIPNSARSNSCPNGSWNYLVNNNTFFDDHKDFTTDTLIQHGTWVTQLLLKELPPNQNIKIISMKILNENKQGTLFDLLCSISGAIKSKVNAINMSLGYYGSENELLKKYMWALNKNKIWVFAAAGNKNERADEQETISNPRNLSERKYKFYPACFNSKELDNIITITSFSKETRNVCEDQNFSSNFVNIGVITDIRSGFYAYNRSEAKYLVGSSYATPIFAGKAIGNIIRNRTILRFPLLDSLSTIHIPSLTTKIKTGLIINR